MAPVRVSELDDDTFDLPEEAKEVPSITELRIRIAAEDFDVAVLDRMCARVEDADRDRFRLQVDLDSENAYEFMNAHRRYMAAKEALRRYAKMLTAQFVDRRDPLEYGNPPIERVEGLKAEVMMIIWANGVDYDPFLNPLMSEWSRACYLGDVGAIRSLLATKGRMMLQLRESIMYFNGVLHVVAGVQRLAVPHMRDVLPEQKPDSIADVLQALLCLLDNGSDANAHDIAGNTALHHCACADPGNALSEALVFMALVLVSNYGADVNARNCAGRTPLFYAVLLKNSRMCKQLLKNGADFLAFDYSSNTIADAADASGSEPWVQELLNMHSDICLSEMRRSRSDKKEQECLKCDVCGAQTERLQRCAQCHSRYYCGKRCQRQDWRRDGHRDACPVLKQNKERSGEARVLLGGALDKMEGLIDILAGLGLDGQ